ncbi:epoxide hydrolase family protein [Sphingomonas jatrophae]|uniref:Pimeloyl-ACP methyl ester carboxylesterase n=1 Tax=Sphingomonas jatrophae TaxID=1166337 RepID=A0A1I6KEC7_9SPHN|nr:epoxide hydrolase family protein [Sphingomonas jatrophae]SFR89567.1 Pimeloyl-ACP methyl ester carboxylesterase [Sphingomonas jatrophae]
MTVRPFRIDVPQARLDWIERRLAEAEWPDRPEGDPWHYGASVDAMRDLVAYWRDGYDWRAREAAMNRLPQFLVDVEVDGVPYAIHLAHLVGKGPSPKPVMLLHGWPGSFVEFLDAAEQLADPTAHGGDAADALSVVIPSLIGYGFSSKPRKPIGPRTIARAMDQAMAALGYTDYVAQGGDWGSSVSGWLGYEGQGCSAIHINFTMGWTRPDAQPETDEEKAAAQKLADVWRTESGYMVLQSTKPLSLSYAMSDSPLGVAAWLVEKFQTWSQLKDGDLWSVYTRDQILDNIMVYLANNTFGTASWLYRGVYDEPVPAGARVTKPVGVANFPGELALFPRSTVEKSYNVVRWTDMPAGGHFAAMEQPALFVEELRAFMRTRG